jgi:hypothetical protein
VEHYRGECFIYGGGVKKSFGIVVECSVTLGRRVGKDL